MSNKTQVASSPHTTTRAESIVSPPQSFSDRNDNKRTASGTAAMSKATGVYHAFPPLQIVQDNNYNEALNQW
jgi:hypothetical protein